MSPEVKMTFAFLNKSDGTITTVAADSTPLTQFQRDPNYQKLYEEAHIEVYQLMPVIRSNFALGVHP